MLHLGRIPTIPLETGRWYELKPRKSIERRGGEGVGRKKNKLNSYSYKPNEFIVYHNNIRGAPSKVKSLESITKLS